MLRARTSWQLNLVLCAMITEAIIFSALILGGGALGGYASYLSEGSLEGELKRRLFLGVTAAAVVPMFLNMISSSIMEGTQELYDYFIFSGFCVIAGFSSKAFLTSISKQLLDRVDTIEEQQHDLQQEVDPLLERETEPEDDSGFRADAIVLTEDERKVMRALGNTNYSRRSIAGIEKSSNMEETDVIYCLVTLREKGLVGRKIGKNRDLFWLTGDGRSHLQGFED